LIAEAPYLLPAPPQIIRDVDGQPKSALWLEMGHPFCPVYSTARYTGYVESPRFDDDPVQVYLR
jgi:hypothetical protein